VNGDSGLIGEIQMCKIVKNKRNVGVKNIAMAVKVVKKERIMILTKKIKKNFNKVIKRKCIEDK
jgi:chemotaxis receptor (MCP) glutamine deamidase CheD